MAMLNIKWQEVNRTSNWEIDNLYLFSIIKKYKHYNNSTLHKLNRVIDTMLVKCINQFNNYPQTIEKSKTTTATDNRHNS